MIKVLDSTLREGEQTPGVHFDNHIKLRIAELLDEIGIDIIETGHPAVTKNIKISVQTIANKGLNARIGAHSRLLKSDIDLAIECGVKFLGVFYCVSDNRLNEVFNKDMNYVSEQIFELISYIKSSNPDIWVRYTPEDTVRSEYDNVLAASVAAASAGADVISIADTTGYMVPGTERSMFDLIKRLKTDLQAKDLSPMIAAHCHNDRGLALANALDALRAGAEIIDASVLGLGERAGIVDLAQLLAVLNTNFNVQKYDLTKLTELYNLVSVHSNIPIPVHYPVVGKNAFTHCAGVHTHAAAKNPMHYEDLNPELFGRERHFSLDHMSGIASIKYALNILKITDLNIEEEYRLLNEVKKIGEKGRTVELNELPHLINFIKHNAENKNI